MTTATRHWDVRLELIETEDYENTPGFMVSPQARIEDTEENFEIITAPESFESVLAAVQTAGIEPQVAEVMMVPQNYVKPEGKPSPEAETLFLRNFKNSD